MSNQAHLPAGPGGGQFTSGDGSGGKVTNAVKETQKLRLLADARKFRPDRTSIRGINPPAMTAPDYRQPNTNPNARWQRADAGGVPAHSMGVHNATAGKSLGGGGGGQGGGRFSGNPAKRGKTLAQLSAMGAITRE
jgi:hypothetical protein